MTKETHDTIVEIMNGIFNIPVRERSIVQRNAVVRYWRNRHRPLYSAWAKMGRYSVMKNPWQCVLISNISSTLNSRIQRGWGRANCVFDLVGNTQESVRKTCSVSWKDRGSINF